MSQNYSIKFDHIITNPPWSRSLALPILEKCLSITSNVVTVQPINTIQYDIHNHYSQYENSIGQYLERYEKIDHRSFNVKQDGEVAIMKFGKGKDKWKELLLIDNSEKAQKVKNANLESLRQYARRVTSGPYWLTIPSRHGNYRDLKKQWDYYDLLSPKTKVNDIGAKNGIRIYFNTLKEAENFRQSVFTESYKYIISIYKKTSNSALNSYPIMPSYKTKWNDKRFSKFFGWD